MIAFVKRNWKRLLFVLCELVVGILLLIRPVSLTAGVIVAGGIVLLAMAAQRIVKYFRTKPELAVRGQDLAEGLMLLLAGIFCVCKYGWFIAAFPVLATLYGTVMLFCGMFKVQWAVDLWRLKNKNALWESIGAAVTVVFALIILLNPFATTLGMWLFAGITLIATAALDLSAMILRQQK